MTAPARDVPHVTAAQMAEVDRAMTVDLGVDLLQMMENAGRHLAHLGRRRFLNGVAAGRGVVVLAGTGGNGGGALVAARRLHAWGAAVRVVLASAPGELTPAASRQLDIARRFGVPVADAAAAAGAPSADLILDGLIGYALAGAPRGAAADLIRWANAQGAPILSLDVPSGLEATTGVIREPAIRAGATLTLALPKTGLRAPGAARFVGELYLADIGVPPALYRAMGIDASAVFARDDVLRLD
jgi:NAD(P)H-hydrate epimerase